MCSILSIMSRHFVITHIGLYFFMDPGAVSPSFGRPCGTVKDHFHFGTGKWDPLVGPGLGPWIVTGRVGVRSFIPDACNFSSAYDVNMR